MKSCTFHYRTRSTTSRSKLLAAPLRCQAKKQILWVFLNGNIWTEFFWLTSSACSGASTVYKNDKTLGTPNLELQITESRKSIDLNFLLKLFEKISKIEQNLYCIPLLILTFLAFAFIKLIFSLKGLKIDLQTGLNSYELNST